jgi:RNA polymerase sigma-70 factor (ECF subfamily)
VGPPPKKTRADPPILGPGGSVAGAAYPSTRWSRIVGADPAARTAPDVEALAQTYWRPVYGYIRALRPAARDEAVDLTQDFFLWMIEHRLLERAHPERGRFRGFLKASLRNFLSDRERRRRAAKRGGDRLHLPIEPGDDALHELPLGTRPQTPEEVLDALWRSTLVERATASLEEELRAQGRGAHFEVFRDYFLSTAEQVDYEELGRRHGLTPTQVSNHLMLAKRRYRDLLRCAVMETVADPEELEQELRWLFGERWS